VNLKAEPLVSLRLDPDLPPLRSMIFLQIARPIPLPGYSVRRAGDGRRQKYFLHTPAQCDPVVERDRHVQANAEPAISHRLCADTRIGICAGVCRKLFLSSSIACTPGPNTPATEIGLAILQEDH